MYVRASAGSTALSLECALCAYCRPTMNAVKYLKELFFRIMKPTLLMLSNKSEIKRNKKNWQAD